MAAPRKNQTMNRGGNNPLQQAGTTFGDAHGAAFNRQIEKNPILQAMHASLGSSGGGTNTPKTRRKTGAGRGKRSPTQT